MLQHSGLFQAIAVGRGAIENEQRNLSAQNAKLLDIDREIGEASGELERLRELERADRVSRALGEETAPPVKPKRLTRIANLEEHAEALRLARPIQLGRCNEARAGVDEANRALANLVLPHFAEMRTERFEACRKPLEDLLEALTECAAIDRAQDFFLGQDFVIPSGTDLRGLFRGSIIALTFRSGLPHKLQQLATDSLLTIEHRIHSASNRILDQVEGGPAAEVPCSETDV